MVSSEVPRRGSAHAEAANQDAVLVYSIGALYGIDGLENVDLARKLVCVVVTTVRMEHDCVIRSEFPGRALPLIQEADFIQRLSASVQPDIEAPLPGEIRIICRRNYQPVRLDAAIDFRYVSSND